MHHKLETSLHTADTAILSAALRFAVTVLPDGDDPDYEGIRMLSVLPDPLAALVWSPHLRDAARLALHRFAIGLIDKGYSRKAAAADDLAFRLKAGLRNQPGG